jgi:hypothetical protein
MFFSIYLFISFFEIGSEVIQSVDEKRLTYHKGGSRLFKYSTPNNTKLDLILKVLLRTNILPRDP